MADRFSGDTEPVVTVVMAAFNVEEYVDDSVLSVRNQSLESIEILIVDDKSTDRTRAILSQHAEQDPRIRILDGGGRGPSAARNLAIAEGRGRWIAVVDADDLIAPQRLALLVEEAERHDADAVADNLMAFYEPGGPQDHPWIDPELWPSPRALSFRDLMAGGLGRPAAPELGYLKPVLRRDRLVRLGTPYREFLVIGEDFDLMARWTAAGLSYRYLPQTTYRYRRRASSLSYRLSAGQIGQIIEGLESMDPEAPHYDIGSIEARMADLRNMHRYAERLQRLKGKDLKALAPLLRDTDSRRRLWASIREGLVRRARLLTSSASA